MQRVPTTTPSKACVVVVSFDASLLAMHSQARHDEDLLLANADPFLRSRCRLALAIRFSHLVNDVLCSSAGIVAANVCACCAAASSVDCSETPVKSFPSPMTLSSGLTLALWSTARCGYPQTQAVRQAPPPTHDSKAARDCSRAFTANVHGRSQQMHYDRFACVFVCFPRFHPIWMFRGFNIYTHKTR